MKGCIIILLLLLAGTALFSQTATPAGEWESLLEAANTFFRQGMEMSATDSWKARNLFEKAAIYYEKTAADGRIKNGRLFYNIGNAYFRMGDIGRAILNYLKAGQYLADDKNLQQNLAYARTRRLDKVEEKQETQLVKTVFFWHYILPSSVRLTIFAVFFLLVWAIAILKLFFRQGLLNFFLILCLVVTVLFLGSLLVELFGSSGERPGVILATEVVARKGDSDTYEKSFQEPLHAGTEFLLIEERRDWYNIELKDGRTCWVPLKDAGLVR